MITLHDHYSFDGSTYLCIELLEGHLHFKLLDNSRGPGRVMSVSKFEVNQSEPLVGLMYALGKCLGESMIDGSPRRFGVPGEFSNHLRLLTVSKLVLRVLP